MVNVKPVQVGKNTRMSFAKIDEVLEMPNLIEVQKNSYNWFLNEGLKEVFKDVSGITDYTGNLVLDFVDYRLDVDKPNYSIEECKERDATYAAALRVTARLLNKESGEIPVSPSVLPVPDKKHQISILPQIIQIRPVLSVLLHNSFQVEDPAYKLPVHFHQKSFPVKECLL